MKKLLFCVLLMGLLVLPAARRWSPASAQALPDASGIWTGTLPSGVSLELRLTQDGQALSGYSSLQQQDPNNPILSDVRGELNSAGQALLQLNGMEYQGESEFVMTVEMAVNGDQAQARLVNAQAGTATGLTMTRLTKGDPPGAELTVDTSSSRQLRLWNHDLTPFQTYKPPEAYHVDFNFKLTRFSLGGPYYAHVTVKLAGSLLTELAGSWQLNETSDSQGVVPTLPNGLSFRSGRVAAWNYVGTPRVSRIIFKTPDTLTLLGQIDFDRISSGQVGATSSQRRYAVDSPKNWMWLKVPNPPPQVIQKDGYTILDHSVGYTVTLDQP